MRLKGKVRSGVKDRQKRNDKRTKTGPTNQDRYLGNGNSPWVHDWSMFPDHDQYDKLTEYGITGYPPLVPDGTDNERQVYAEQKQLVGSRLEYVSIT